MNTGEKREVELGCFTWVLACLSLGALLTIALQLGRIAGLLERLAR